MKRDDTLAVAAAAAAGGGGGSWKRSHSFMARINGNNATNNNNNSMSSSSASSRKSGSPSNMYTSKNHNKISKGRRRHNNMLMDLIVQWKSYYCTYLFLITVLFAIQQMIHDHYDSTTTTTSPSDWNTISSTTTTTNANKLTTSTSSTTNTNTNTTTIAYVVTITSCTGHEKDTTFQIVEGAAVLKYSIHRNSIHGRIQQRQQQQQRQQEERDYGDNTQKQQREYGMYDYHMYAIYHPDAKRCAEALIDIGYTIIERATPVAVADIQNTELRERIVHNGCCGEKELLKFEAWTFIQYSLVVLLDIDILVVQPLDRLFTFMLNTTVLPHDDDLLYYHRPAISGPNSINITIPSQLDLLYTTDYAMVEAKRKIKPTQGGFVILRPNMTIYNDFVNIIKEGDFQFEGRSDLGWGGRTGRFWGAMTFQGLMPYYYQVLHPGRALELNWCRWNNMGSPSYDIRKNHPEIKTCYTLQDNCENCRLRSIQNVSLIHYTVCQKPWLCQYHKKEIWNEESNLCHDFHKEWFRIRSYMELSWGRTGNGTSNWQYDSFLGYCSSYGRNGYIPIAKPYGLPVTTTTKK